MIRPATPADMTEVVRLLKDSREGAGFDRPDGPTGFVFPFDPAYAQRLFLLHLTPRCLCIVHDVDGKPQGVLMASMFEHPFGAILMANETVWWIDVAHRGTAAVRMLAEYEKWWKSQGCKFGGMAGMGKDPVVAKLYERRGYKLAETHYLKAA